MKITDYKTYFQTELQACYPATEVQSFFYLLLEQFAAVTRLQLAIHPELQLTTQQEQQFHDAVERLKQDEPVQYIMGETTFYGLPFKVTDAVLIPRPETEELVAWIIADCETKIAPFSLLDIGTGSGCIPISLAHHLPQAEVAAIDVSKAALHVAQANAKLNHVAVEFQCCDILQPHKWPHKVDLMVSNPPYVRELEKAEMHDNVLKHEPELALFVDNADPLVFYRKIIEFAQINLITGGYLYFEVNQYLHDDLVTLFKHFEITAVQFKNDIFGNLRMVKLTL